MAHPSYMNLLQPELFTRIPESSDIFLESERLTVTYGELAGITHAIDLQVSRQDLFYSQQNPLLVPAIPGESLILFLAACQLLKLPVFPFNPDLSEEEITAIFASFPNSCLVTLGGQPDSIAVSTFRKLTIEIPRQADARPDLINRYCKELPAQPEKILLYLHTSGTSGPTKIVPVKNRQMLFAAQANAQQLWPGKGSKWLLCLPLHHIGGLSIIGRSLLYGSAVHYAGKFDEQRVGELLAHDSAVKIASLVPTMLKRLLDSGLTDFGPALTGILLGGGPLDAVLVQQALRNRIPIVSSYGMTETCAQIAAHEITGTEKLPEDGSLTGKLFTPNEIQIRDEHHSSLPRNRAGQIFIRGPQVFDGYVNKETVPDHDIFDKDGYFNTGDYGYLDSGGRLIVQSRRTDLIVTGGENVSPFEVEAALKELEGIEEAVVFGLDDEEWGSRVAAAILPEDTGVSIEVSTIKARLSGRLKSFQIPKTVFTRTEGFPRTDSGKIKRKEIAGYYRGLNKKS